MAVKTCNKCLIEKPVEEFPLHYNNQRKKSYRKAQCKPCRAKAVRDWNAANPEKRAATHKKAAIKYRYSLDEGTYLDMISRGCEVCGSKDKLVVDHDHSCCPGEKSCGSCVRGVLCKRHNTALGNVKDDINELMSLAAYLLKRKNLFVGDIQ